MDFLLQHVHRHIALHLGLRCFLFGLREGFLVHLLVLVERNPVDLHRYSGHHVRRFLLHDEVVQCLDVNGFISNNIGCDELAAALLVEGLHGGVLDTWELADDTLDLFELDAESTNLDLSVLASHELDVAIREIAHDVAGAVDVRVFLAGIEGVGDIDLSGFLGTIEVAPGHLRSGNPQLARCAHGQTAARLIDDVKLDVVQRPANRNVLHGLRHVEGGDADGAFGGAVEVHQRVVRGGSERSQLLAASQQIAQPVIFNGRGKLISHLRGHESVGNMLFFKIFVQRYQVQAQLFGNDVERGTASESGIGFHDVGIETITGVGRNAAVGSEVEPAVVPLAKSDDIAMHDLTTLGCTRSAGGVKHDEKGG